MPAPRYDIHISFEADEDVRGTARALLKVFGENMATTADPKTVSESGDRLRVRFDEVTHDIPPPGEAYSPPREEDPTEAAARMAIEQLTQAHLEGTPVIPILRALVALSAARARAGLSPRQRITIEVEPSRVHQQEELRHS